MSKIWEIDWELTKVARSVSHKALVSRVRYQHRTTYVLTTEPVSIDLGSTRKKAEKTLRCYLGVLKDESSFNH